MEDTVGYVETVVLELKDDLAKIGDIWTDGSMRYARWVDRIDTIPSESVGLEPEHCNGEGCAICHDRYVGAWELGNQAGKASLKPFDDKKIASHSAESGRKPWACTPEQADAILNEMRDKGILTEHYDEGVALRGVINHILGLQPAPEEAERCPDCEHKNGKDTHVSAPSKCSARYCNCTNQWHRERGEAK